MGTALKTATLAMLLLGGGTQADAPPLAENNTYVTIQGKMYRQRPPGAVCDPNLYGTPIKEEPQKPIPKEPIYFALLAAAVAITADTLRRKQDALISRYEIPEREFDFFNQRRRPIIDYRIEVEEREKF
jgi:hypothetical protein